jgi:molybdopterin-binding protein
MSFTGRKAMRAAAQGDFIRPKNTLMSGIGRAVSTGGILGRRSRLVISPSVGRCVALHAQPNIVRTVMRISARNQIKGTVIDVKKGATTSHIRVDIGNGQIVTSSITNEAVDELGIKAKDKVIVVVKASDVMIAVD